MTERPKSRFLLFTCFSQGLFYVLTGLWPIIDIMSFQRVTGPKTDIWLVQTVGVLVAASGLGYLIAACRRHISPEVAWIAGSQALALASIDLLYACTGRISQIYLLDALVELTFVVIWLRHAGGIGQSSLKPRIGMSVH